MTRYSSSGPLRADPRALHTAAGDSGGAWFARRSWRPVARSPSTRRSGWSSRARRRGSSPRRAERHQLRFAGPGSRRRRASPRLPSAGPRGRRSGSPGRELVHQCSCDLMGFSSSTMRSSSPPVSRGDVEQRAQRPRREQRHTSPTGSESKTAARRRTAVGATSCRLLPRLRAATGGRSARPDGIQPADSAASSWSRSRSFGQASAVSSAVIPERYAQTRCSVVVVARGYGYDTWTRGGG